MSSFKWEAGAFVNAMTDAELRTEMGDLLAKGYLSTVQRSATRHFVCCSLKTNKHTKKDGRASGHPQKAMTTGVYEAVCCRLESDFQAWCCEHGKSIGWAERHWPEHLPSRKQLVHQMYFRLHTGTRIDPRLDLSHIDANPQVLECVQEQHETNEDRKGCHSHGTYVHHDPHRGWMEIKGSTCPHDPKCQGPLGADEVNVLGAGQPIPGIPAAGVIILAPDSQED
jgi:hypothetical protein